MDSADFANQIQIEIGEAIPDVYNFALFSLYVGYVYIEYKLCHMVGDKEF